MSQIESLLIEKEEIFNLIQNSNPSYLTMNALKRHREILNELDSLGHGVKYFL